MVRREAPGEAEGVTHTQDLLYGHQEDGAGHGKHKVITTHEGMRQK